MASASKCIAACSYACHFKVISSPNALTENIFLLVLTAAVKIGFTAWTFGMMVRALMIPSFDSQH